MTDLSEPRLVVRASAIHQRGCFAAEPIAAGTRVREYRGERIRPEEALRREADPARPGIYTVWLDHSVIDGWVGGNESIYINHACTPNCDFDFAGDRVFICANRAIAAGEELTLDYAYDADTELEPCFCATPNCRGYLNDLSSA